MKTIGTVVALLGMLLFYYSIYRIIRKAIHKSKNPAEKWKTSLLIFAASFVMILGGSFILGTSMGSTTQAKQVSSSSSSKKRSSSSHHKDAKKKPKMTKAEAASSRKVSASESASMSKADSESESAALSSSSAKAASSSAKEAARAGALAKINQGIAASLKEDQNWSANGKTDYDWSTYVISIKFTSKRKINVQVNTKVKMLTEDAIKQLAISCQNLTITTLMEQDKLKPGEDTNGLFTDMKSGVVPVAQSHVTDYQEIRVYLHN